MKRMTLIALALCLIMLTTVGAGAVAAKENPRQAGSSHIYFYDVIASDTHGKGKLQINVDTHTFEFNGQGFSPSAQIELRARAAGSSDFKVFATGKATPSGNLHIAGTWEKDVAPAEVLGATSYVGDYIHEEMDISYFNLWVKAPSGFVAKLACYYSTDGGATWTESSHTSGIPVGQEKQVELSSLGVPQDALVKIHAIVVGGKDRTGSTVWRYDGRAQDIARYYMTGTTWNPTLWYLDKISCYACY